MKGKPNQLVPQFVFEITKETSPFSKNDFFVSSQNMYNTRLCLWYKLSNDFKMFNSNISFTHNYQRLVENLE